MNEFTPTSLPVSKQDQDEAGTVPCPYSRCWYEHQHRVKVGDKRCVRCGVVLEWVE